MLYQTTMISENRNFQVVYYIIINCKQNSSIGSIGKGVLWNPCFTTNCSNVKRRYYSKQYWIDMFYC